MIKKKKHVNAYIARGYIESSFFANCGEPICKIMSLIKSDVDRFEAEHLSDTSNLSYGVGTVKRFIRLTDKVNNFTVDIYQDRYYSEESYYTNLPWVTRTEAVALEYYSRMVLIASDKRAAVERIAGYEKQREEAKKLYDL